MSGFDRNDASAGAPGVDPTFAQDVVRGLSQDRKALACRWFYDARGSELFEEITQLEEYYPTRSESEILAARAGDIATIASVGAALVEFGSGSSRKTEILLAAMPDLSAYAPIDVSASALDDAERRLHARFPTLRIFPVLGDFAGDLRLPSEITDVGRLGFFPGSTIGNFHPDDARRLLAKFATALGDGAQLLIGVDLRKSADILLPAYDDRSGVTAEFNLNLLRRINRELGGDFDLAGFAHEAVWNAPEGRIEMYLTSRREQSARVQGHIFRFRQAERIHTENSYKHTISGFQELARAAGWRPTHVWTDDARRFSLHLLSFGATG